MNSRSTGPNIGSVGIFLVALLNLDTPNSLPESLW